MGIIWSKIGKRAGTKPNPILLKLRLTFKEGRREEFEKNQKELCKVRL
jgi:hypothetical protein